MIYKKCTADYVFSKFLPASSNDVREVWFYYWFEQGTKWILQAGHHYSLRFFRMLLRRGRKFRTRQNWSQDIWNAAKEGAKERTKKGREKTMMFNRIIRTLKNWPISLLRLTFSRLHVLHITLMHTYTFTCFHVYARPDIWLDAPIFSHNSNNFWLRIFRWYPLMNLGIW